MTARVTVSWAALSDRGRQRDHNEDSWGGEVAEAADGKPHAIFVVCDGVGGQADGDVASALAVNEVRTRLRPLLAGAWDEADVEQRLQETVLETHRAIFAHNERQGGQGRERAGTTLVLLALAGPRAWVAHVGDSRAYQVTRHGLSQLTADHNVATREMARGVSADEAWQRRDARHLTQALGPLREEYLHPTIRPLRLDEDAGFVLCTDGMSDGNLVELNETKVLRPLVAADSDLEEGCRRLVGIANDAGGHDNITVVLVRVSGVPPRAESATTRDPRAETQARGVGGITQGAR